MSSEKPKAKKDVVATLPTKFGLFHVRTFDSALEQFPHLALYTPNYHTLDPVSVRIHSECMTGDVFHSVRCDCGEQLDFAMQWMQQHGGIVIYLRQEGRGIGLINKLAAYNLQDEGYDTEEANLKMGFHADERSYDVALEILQKMGVRRIKLLTNNPEKLAAFKTSAIEVVERVPIEIEPQAENAAYLKTKRERMGHLLFKAS